MALQLGSQRGSHDSAVRRPHRGSLSGTGRGSRDLPPVDAPSASLGARPLLAWAWAPGFKGHRCMGAGHAPWTLCALVGRCGWALIHSSQRGASREGSGCGDPRAFPPSSQPVTWVQQVTRERVWVWLVQAPIHRPPGGCFQQVRAFRSRFSAKNSKWNCGSASQVPERMKLAHGKKRPEAIPKAVQVAWERRASPTSSRGRGRVRRGANLPDSVPSPGGTGGYSGHLWGPAESPVLSAQARTHPNTGRRLHELRQPRGPAEQGRVAQPRFSLLEDGPGRCI